MTISTTRRFTFLLIIICLIAFADRIPAQKFDKDAIKFSHPHGFYDTPFTLTISSDIPGAQIRYTLNGTNPLTSSTKFFKSSPASVIINPEVTAARDFAPGYVVTACVVVADTLASDIVSQTYLFPNKITLLSRNNLVPGPGWLVPGETNHAISYGLDPRVYTDTRFKNYITDAFMSIPTMSVVMDLNGLFNPDSGIYLNAFKHGEEWERKASLELLVPPAPWGDGGEGFQINCGIRIRGGWSRHDDNPKHAFRFFFRKEYGKSKLKYPLFDDEGVDEFDAFDLRTSQNYSWAFYGDASNTFLRDVFSRDTQRDMNQPYTRSRFYHLYINGTYWGLFQTQERSEASFAQSYFGGSADDYDVIKVDVGENFNLYNVEATDGTLDAWRRLWDASQLGFSEDAAYYKVQGLNPDGTKNPDYEKLVDVDNLIDYMLVTFFVGDFDGPISNFRSNQSPNNFYAVYNRVDPDGFKFLRHDAEHTLFYNDWGYDRTGPFPAGQYFPDSNPQWFHQKLSENYNYRIRFSDRVYKYFFNDGVLTYSKNVERIKSRKDQINTAIIAESARWGDSKSYSPLTKIDWETAVNFITNNYLVGRNDIVLDQLDSKGLFSTVVPPKFSLSGGKVNPGTQVELITSQGKTYYTIDGTDPYQSAGASSNSFMNEVIKPGTAKKVLVPKVAQSNQWYTDLNFNDSNWLDCVGEPGGIGYETDMGYEQYITLSVENYMYQNTSNPNTSCFIRIPFSLTANEVSKANYIYFDIMFDDGFVAYLNGVKIAENNAPSNPAWNSTSETSSSESNGYTRFDISGFTSLLHEGNNLLAIHGLNTSLSSSDFLILPKLTIGSKDSGGKISDSAIEYNGPILINGTMKISARTLFNSELSPLSQAVFVIEQDLEKLKVTELNYHPLDQISGSDTVDGKEYEFIELKNAGQVSLDLNLASFINGIEFSFGSDSKLAPGEMFVLASNKEMFNQRYGFYPFGEFEGQLDNGGEKIVLVDGLQDTLLNFRYNDKDPWPNEADGDGYTLVSIGLNPVGNPDDASYWALSAALNGSPGKDDLVSDAETDDTFAPELFALYQNYPNPFNPVSNIKYQIARMGHVNLTVYDILGREVTVLKNEVQSAGNYNVIFDASLLSSGVYFYKLSAGKFISVRKMMFVK